MSYYPPQILLDVPEDSLVAVTSSCRRDGATKITQQKTRDGTWVIVAEFNPLSARPRP